MKSEVSNSTYPRFIVFVGIDGSGKTSVAGSVEKILNARGFKTKYVWLNSVPILLKPFRFMSQKIFLKGENIQKDYSAYNSARKKKAAKMRSLRKVYYSIMFFDYFIRAYFLLMPLYLKKKIIVCDRYIIDIVVNLGDILDYSLAQEIKLIKWMQLLLPKPDSVILLDVDEKTAFKRKSDTPHIDYLKSHRRTYLDLANKFGFKIVDTSKSLDLVINEVKFLLNLA